MSESFAIPTEYNGIHFRSRLEATWAAFLDHVGCDWKYEPRDLAGYIPDFVMALEVDHEAPWRPPETLIEVKPASTLEELRRHTDKIERSGWVDTACLVGLEPCWTQRDREPPPGSAWAWSLAHHRKHGAEYPPIIGLMSRFEATPLDIGQELAYEWRRVWQPGVLFVCWCCTHYAILPEAAVMEPPRPCGAVEAGGRHCPGSMHPVRACALEVDWAQAKNDTQWRPRG